MINLKYWKNKDKGQFLQRLGTLLKQGYTLSTAIELLRYHQKQNVKKSLQEMLEKLRQGEPFHEILATLNFPKEVLGYLYFSENHGDLSFALKESGVMMHKREEVKARFQKLVSYPIILIWLVVVITIFMVRFLFPQFQSLYDSMNIDFPWITVVFLNVVKASPLIFAIFCILLFFLLLFYLIKFRRFHPQKQFSLLIRLPLLRHPLSIIVTQYFSVQLSCLLRGGLSIYEALNIFEKQHHLAFFQQEAFAMKEALKRGEALDDILRDNPFYVDEVAEVVAHGQSNGQLAQELLNYSELLMEMTEEKIKKSFMVMQPLIFAGIGIFVLVMFVSMMLPIFQLMNSL